MITEFLTAMIESVREFPPVLLVSPMTENQPFSRAVSFDEAAAIQVIGICQSIERLNKKLRSVALFDRTRTLPALSEL